MTQEDKQLEREKSVQKALIGIKKKFGVSAQHYSFAVKAFVDTVKQFGTFGYELDITKLSKEARALIPKQIERYKEIRRLVQSGDYYHIASLRENGRYDVTLMVSKDKSEAFVIYMQPLTVSNIRSTRIRLHGLDEEARYDAVLDDVSFEREEKREIYEGDALVNAGYLFPAPKRDFASFMLRLKRV